MKPNRNQHRALLYAVLLAAAALLPSCSLMRTTGRVLGIHEQEPPPNPHLYGAPANEWAATWQGERDATLRELRFGKEGQ